jgi:KRAB domain-containing zinc finger protein
MKNKIQLSVQSVTKNLEEKTILSQHIKIVHEKQKPFECQICKNAFGKRGDLLLHTKMVHKKQKPFECKICKKAFGKRSDLLLHTKKVHNSCRTCS